jgi:hypothetical protein
MKVSGIYEEIPLSSAIIFTCIFTGLINNLTSTIPQIAQIFDVSRKIGSGTFSSVFLGEFSPLSSKCEKVRHF